MEEAIKLCRDWADSTMCKGSWGAEDGFLINLIAIWHSVLDNGGHFFSTKAIFIYCSPYVIGKPLNVEVSSTWFRHMAGN